MACCNNKTDIDYNIDFEQLGCACDTWAHLKDMFAYINDQRNGVVPCKTSQFTVQWSTVDASTYLFVVTDNLTAEVLEYSVVKEFTKETPQVAFERDYHEKEVRHNRGVLSALYDQLEAMEEVNVAYVYKLSISDDGFIIHRRLANNLGVVVFKISFSVEAEPNNLPWSYQLIDNTITLPAFRGAITATLDKLLKRYRKIGVAFSDVTTTTVKDFTQTTITGRAYRSPSSNIVIKISYQEMDMTDPNLNTYYEYYTDKGEQNGFNIC